MGMIQHSMTPGGRPLKRLNLIGGALFAVLLPCHLTIWKSSIFLAQRASTLTLTTPPGSSHGLLHLGQSESFLPILVSLDFIEAGLHLFSCEIPNLSILSPCVRTHPQEVYRLNHIACFSENTSGTEANAKEIEDRGSGQVNA